MVKKLEKMYFIGEYGFAYRQLLPFLEAREKSLQLVTWEPLTKIISLLWPGKFDLISAELYIDGADEGVRNCNHYRDKNVNARLTNLGFKHCFDFDPARKFFYDNARATYALVKTRLAYGEQRVEKPFVSIFPRNRKIQSAKNVIGEAHANWLREKYPDKKIMGHGLKEERKDLTVEFCEDIYHQINVLNNSEVLITPASGMADLALMCGCSIILTDRYDTIEKVNHHNCKITMWEDVK